MTSIKPERIRTKCPVCAEGCPQGQTPTVWYPEHIEQHIGKKLYLEQRISIVRTKLNRETMEFKDALPEEVQMQFYNFIMDCITILDGDMPELG